MKNNYGRYIVITLITIIIFLFALTVKSYAAGLPAALQETVTGTVKDEAGMPLPGVTVTVKGSNRGTATNIDGEYQITVAPQGTLVFSFVGFKVMEVPVDGRGEINVRLVEDITALDEVQINAGYYNTTRRESTGNISRVTAEEIELQPVVSPLQALQGRMAGVEIIPGGSHPGMAPTIRIRGTNSLREEGNYPLYIIDGVPINATPVETSSLAGYTGIDPLSNLDLNNIASIEVLKDADATAIYGSRGANGVVLITTKKNPGVGSLIEARFYYGTATAPGRLDLLNTEEYLDIRRRAFENDGVEPTARNAYDLLLWDQERYTDWQDFLIGGTAETTNANLTYSGGNETTSFRLGGSYFKQSTIYPGDYDYRKMSGNLNLRHRSIDNKFNLQLSTNYSRNINNLVGNVSFNAGTIFLPPNAPAIFNEDGSLHWEDWGVAGLSNPLQGFFNQSTTQTNNFITNVALSYEFLPGLQFKTSLGYTYFDSQELRKQPRRSYNPSGANTSNSSHIKLNRSSWIAEPQLHFRQSFGKLNIESLIGATFQENENSLERFQAIGYVTEALIGKLAAAERISFPRRENSEYRYIALFSRLGLNWDKKYFLNLTGRRDGSSRFGPNNRFANFGAVGTAWIFTEEGFIENNLPFLSFGKLRGSYGTTGNDQIGDYGYLDAYEATTGPGGLYPTALANPNYSWEVNKKLEGGIELGFFEDRLRLGVSRYQNRSSNQLVGYPLPYTTGFSSVQANLPATVENSGWEFEFTSFNVSNKDFAWETSFNFTFPRNELVSYPDIEQSSYANTYRVGHPLNIDLLYEYTGLDPETGFYTIRDVNDDGRYDYNDRLIIKDMNRKYFGGMNNSFSFKNISLQFLLQFVKQEGKLSNFNIGRINNILKEALNNEDSYQTITQSYEGYLGSFYTQNSTFPYRNASFLRLKNISLNYDLPLQYIETAGLENFRLFLHGQNLLTFSSFDAIDPEQQNPTSFGNLRSITGGLQINF
ncbi:SusC/RagA family TonB-linked outer membrane protein [Salinimicrobium sp. MT39]|uniref:SusC/RagA family TonB-linked outer membrane protein n=1 Tax=Salinimicrobium profundisediminis TaxID=2994553 RepID=A0A9X3HZZ6_9FLAO|nr:SusC/RagA family TonB-linked outer membrane protein [Salinimicrobium profundisediminis]MCX2837470.1 SusC/RagA family TonB-linked outer membrane protein [Salinimicrobium profundisediminis]